ncbi:hypothetical protein RIF29_34935 [Crotalaria pallida]|uniref:Endonuclease/exonuclease/phosphatase domain-containing protein n=1 Tax=Crotalaria pallida TaxID=3830 RepID=A0AAN9EBM7_CROPI
MARKKGRPPKASSPPNKFTSRNEDSSLIMDLSALDEDDLAEIDAFTPKQLEKLMHGLEAIKNRLKGKSNRVAASEAIKDLLQNESVKEIEGEKDSNALNVEGILDGEAQKVAAALNQEEGEWTPIKTRSKAQLRNVLLRDAYAVNIVAVSSQYMHCLVNFKPQGVEFAITFVYGANDAVLHPHEKLGGQEIEFAQVMDFRNCVDMCNLQDMVSLGCSLTWKNKQIGSDRIYSKLDRALVNDSWISTWPSVTANFLNEGVSDHSPIVIAWNDFQGHTKCGLSSLECGGSRYNHVHSYAKTVLA